MVNRKVDRMIMPKLSSTLGEISNEDRNSHKKVLKRRNVIKSKLDQTVSDDYKRHVIDKLQDVIDPYLFEGSIQRDVDLSEWGCGCLMSVPPVEEESNDILCDCPRPNNHGYNPKPIVTLMKKKYIEALTQHLKLLILILG